MKKLTQREIILKLLRNTPETWFYSCNLLKANTPFGYLGSQGDRRARELAEQGLIEVRHIGKYAEYRSTKPKQIITRHIPALGITLQEPLF